MSVLTDLASFVRLEFDRLVSEFESAGFVEQSTCLVKARECFERGDFVSVISMIEAVTGFFDEPYALGGGVLKNVRDCVRLKAAVKSFSVRSGECCEF